MTQRIGFPNADAPLPELIARCVHCGLCLPTCPTFAELGVEMDSPRGRIRLMKNVQDGRLDADSDAFAEHMAKCLDCRACETACPSGVSFGKLMEAARSQVVAARHPGALESLLRPAVFRGLPVPEILAGGTLYKPSASAIRSVASRASVTCRSVSAHGPCSVRSG